MTKYQRSMQIWTLLVCAAYERKTYTYGEIVEILGMGGAGVMSQFLGPIMLYCEDSEYPPLTVLIVNQDTGLPGDGLTTIENVNRIENLFLNLIGLPLSHHKFWILRMQ